MIIIKDRSLTDRHIDKYEIDRIFTADIRSEMKLILFKKNEFLCKEGEPLKYLLFLTQGKAKSYISLENGKNLLICKSLGNKLHRSSHNSSINLLYPLESRLAGYILKTSEETDKINFEGNLTEIAELLATSYRHLLRVLDKFCEMKYLRKNRGIYEVMDYEKLKKLSAEVYI